MDYGIKIKNVVDFSPVQYKKPETDVKYVGSLITSSQLHIIDSIKDNKQKDSKIKIHNQSNLDFLNVPGIQNSLDHITNLSINNDYKGNKLISTAQIALYFTQLVQLDISFNNLNDISNIFTISTLECIIAQDNLIPNLDGIQKLTHLSQLDVTRNHIYDIQAISQCKKLKILKLGQNNVKNISPLLKCQQLRVAELYANPIPRTSFIYMLIVPRIEQIQFMPIQVTNKKYNFQSDFLTYKDYLIYMEKSHLKYYFSFSGCKLLDIRQQPESTEQYMSEQYTEKITKLKAQIQQSFVNTELADLSKELQMMQKKKIICSEFQLLREALNISNMVFNIKFPEITIKKLDVKL